MKLKDAYSPDGMFTEAGAQNTLKYLAAFNPAIKPADIKLGQTFDNSYAQKALAKYKK
jgi:NitT/TauT family transport system substrate-binding protein